MDDLSGADHGASTARQALVGENEGAVFGNLNGSRRTGLFAQTATDACNIAHMEAAGVLVGAEHHNGVGLYTQVDDTLGACQIAGTATDALALVHLRYAVGVEGNSTETAHIDTGTATGTAIVAQIGAVFLLLCAATAVTVDTGDPLGEFFLNDHA